MTEIETGRWMLEGAPPAALLQRLAGLDRVMTVLRHGGATHERIGPVAGCRLDGAEVTLTGPIHSARIDTAQVDRVALDTTSVMAGGSYPSLDFLDAAGAVILRVVAMADPMGFVAAFSDLARQPLDPLDRTMPAPGSAAASEAGADPGQALLERLRDSAALVEIRHARPGLRQSWRGRIETVKPAMGFANVMTADFHLHLRQGTVAGWQQQGALSIALDDAGRQTGLVIETLGDTPA